MSYDFDLFVIGAGSGGIATARRAAEYGAKVGIAEFDRLGGTCVNRGCVPKKLMVYASHFPDQFEEAQGYGWSKVHSTLDWTTMITAVNQETERLNGIYQRMLDNSKVELFQGYAKFVDSHTIDIGGRKVTAQKILIAVGGHPVKPDIPGIEHAITSDDIFHLKEQPKRIVILGGGYIGVEFACILNGLGSEVTVVIRRDQILRGFDAEIGSEIQQAMENHGIRVLNNSKIIAIENTSAGLNVTVQGQSQTTIIADAVSLAATGRIPNIQNLGLENTGVAIENGAIAVDKYSLTTEDHIFAVGDCTNRMNLTPVAINEGRAFADTVFGGKSRIMSYENVPTAIFTTPEAATVGLSEAEAREKYGDAVKVYRSRFRAMYYTLPGRDEKTLMKLVVDQNTDKVLGAHMVGDHAAEIIQGIAIALKTGATKANFDATVGIHPSSAEEFVTMR
ncbi:MULTISPECIES: glutathione-disulfide reductase [unclassified Moorena]|uniref:glutathione-disulfide reductase n=1 Tax=unclassified Moorena TaxID=2683338 RepID=UPI0013C0DA47|nr:MULTISPECIES: glutathione-disulfide reductase [unclassified Moorena]NEO04472.1 glutathione-disulfide reductase [Moorena sp. SIO3I8]NEO21224.1 glutathione-disulfide reductase [Moorena sp. SIO4A5]NEP22300.1 glutathione-disulfide reductase [Moorena sp. SIO3I6]